MLGIKNLSQSRTSYFYAMFEKSINHLIPFIHRTKVNGSGILSPSSNVWTVSIILMFMLASSSLGGLDISVSSLENNTGGHLTLENLDSNGSGKVYKEREAASGPYT